MASVNTNECLFKVARAVETFKINVSLISDEKTISIY